MANSRGWRQGNMFSFCSHKVKPLPAAESRFSGMVVAKVAMTRVVDVGENNRAKGYGFGDCRAMHA
jgi:hypothetical protein